MREQGTVVGIEDGRARVVMEPGEHCRGCGICSHLSASMEIKAEVDEGSGINAGDRVLLDIPAELSYGGIALVYVIPLAGLLLGAVVGTLVTRTWWPEGMYPNLLAAVLAFVGLAAGFGFMAWRERRRLRRTRASIRIVQIL